MALPGSEYRQEYKVGEETRVLLFAVPDFLGTTRARARLNFARDRWISTELWKRYGAAEEGTTVDLSNATLPDYEAWEEWQIACLEETIACVSGLEVAGVADPRPVDDLRAALRNDVTAHHALRMARVALFLNAGATRDAE